MESVDLNNYEAFLLDYVEGNLSAGAAEALKAFVQSHPELEIDMHDLDLPALAKEDIGFPETALLKRSWPHGTDEKVFDLIEGNLDVAEAREMADRMASDPALATLFNDYKKTILPAVPVVFDQKQSLKKTEDDLLIASVALAYFEKQLGKDEKLAFEKELNGHAGLRAEQELLGKTLLQPDLSIAYPQKEKLKKKAKVIFLFSARTLSAVAAAVLLVSGFIFLLKFTQPEPVVPVQDKNMAAADRKVPSSATKTPKVLKPEAAQPPVAAHANHSLPVKVERGQKADAVIHFNEPAVAHQTPTSFEEKPGAEKHEDVFNNDPSTVAKEATDPETKEAAADTNLSATRYTDIHDLAVENELNGLLDDGADKNLWKRAVQLARKANKMGLKVIDGEEAANNKYRLSFNALTVEKK